MYYSILFIAALLHIASAEFVPSWLYTVYVPKPLNPVQRNIKPKIAKGYLKGISSEIIGKYIFENPEYVHIYRYCKSVRELLLIAGDQLDAKKHRSGKLTFDDCTSYFEPSLLRDFEMDLYRLLIPIKYSYTEFSGKYVIGNLEGGIVAYRLAVMRTVVILNGMKFPIIGRRFGLMADARHPEARMNSYNEWMTFNLGYLKMRRIDRPEEAQKGYNDWTAILKPKMLSSYFNSPFYLAPIPDTQAIRDMAPVMIARKKATFTFRVVNGTIQEFKGDTAAIPLLYQRAIHTNGTAA